MALLAGAQVQPAKKCPENRMTRAWFRKRDVLSYAIRRSRRAVLCSYWTAEKSSSQGLKSEGKQTRRNKR